MIPQGETGQLKMKQYLVRMTEQARKALPHERIQSSLMISSWKHIPYEFTLIYNLF